LHIRERRVLLPDYQTFPSDLNKALERLALISSGVTQIEGVPRVIFDEAQALWREYPAVGEGARGLTTTIDLLVNQVIKIQQELPGLTEGAPPGMPNPETLMAMYWTSKSLGAALGQFDALKAEWETAAIPPGITGAAVLGNLERIIRELQKHLAPVLEATPELIGELYGGLVTLHPHLAYNAQPGIEANAGEIVSLYEGLTTGEVDGHPWYSTLFDRILGRDEAPHLSIWENIWLRLQQVILAVVEVNARFWFAVLYRVLNAVWSDEDADRTLEE